MKKHPMTAEAMTAEIQAETIAAIKSLAAAYKEKSERLYRQAEDLYNEGGENFASIDELHDKSEIAYCVSEAFDDLVVFLRTFRN